MSKSILENGKGVLKTDSKKKVSFRGKTDGYDVYRINLNLLYYNDLNDRIATWISKYQDENGELEHGNKDAFNEIIQGFIIDSNEGAFKKTKQNIKALGQREPGVVLSDGRVIDGNRRFTCLREIYQETCKQEFEYFDAIIIEGDENDKDIKALELELQHGIDKQVDYNPIDRLVGIYNDVIKNKVFTEDEYRQHIDVKKTEMKKMVAKAGLMADFLVHINASDKFFIARELEIDGPITEIVNVRKKVKDDFEWDQVKAVAFDYLLGKPKGDITRLIRNLNKIIEKGHFDELFDDHIETSEMIHDIIADGEVSPKTIRKEIRNNEEIKNKLIDVYEKHTEKIVLEEIRTKPHKSIEKANSILEEIDLKVFEFMKAEEKKTVKSKLKKISRNLENLEKKLNA